MIICEAGSVNHLSFGYNNTSKLTESVLMTVISEVTEAIVILMFLSKIKLLGFLYGNKIKWRSCTILALPANILFCDLPYCFRLAGCSQFYSMSTCSLL